MSNPKISIIVPVYKVENYLEACLDSILSQTFTDFELILVNDGSPDQSGKICDEYALKDARIRVFHKRNEGVTSARTLGVKEALGSWLTFVDSDDFLPENALFALYQMVDQDQEIDVAVGAIEIFTPNTVWQKNNLVVGKLDQEQYVKVLLKRECDFGPCCKLIRRDCVDGYPFGIDKEIYQFEDYYANIGIALRVRKVFISNEVVYHYLKRDNSASSILMHPNLWIRLICQLQILLDRDSNFSLFYREFNRFMFDLLLFQVFFQYKSFDSASAIKCVKYEGKKVYSLRERILSLSVESSMIRSLYLIYFRLRYKIDKLIFKDNE